MDIPSRVTSAQRTQPETVFDSNPSDRFRNSSRSDMNNSRSPSGPLSIPNARGSGPPPPLPPPRIVAGVSSPATDVAWQWGNREDLWGTSPTAVKPGSSLYGSFARGSSSLAARKGPTLKPVGVDTRQDTYYAIDERHANLKYNSFSSYKLVFYSMNSSLGGLSIR